MKDVIELNKDISDAKKALAGQILAPGWLDWEKYWIAKRALVCYFLETERDQYKISNLQNELCTIDAQLRLPKDLDEMRQQPHSQSQESED